MNGAQNQQYLKVSEFFSQLTPADISALTATAVAKSFEKNQTIFRRGDLAGTFFLLIEGWVKISRNTGEGEEAVLGILRQGETFGDAALFEGAAYPYDALAAEQTRLLCISAQVLRRQAQENPAVIFRIMESMSAHMDRLRLENEHMSLMSAPQRVGCLLLQFANDPISHRDGAACRVHLPYDKSLAAARLGMKPETFSRALGQLKQVGVSVKGDEISISDLQHLVDFCCRACSISDSCGHARNGCGKTDCGNCGGGHRT